MRTPQQALADALASGAVQAWIEGRKLQGKGDNGVWANVGYNHPSFMNERCYWRPAPTPKLRPWKPEEVPVGALTKTLGKGNEFRWLIVASCSDGVTHCGGTACRSDSVQYMLERCEHSTDGGKTWKPCGVMEGAE